jgi:HEAT repeat protein
MDQNLDVLIEQLKEEDPRRQREAFAEGWKFHRLSAYVPLIWRILS